MRLSELDVQKVGVLRDIKKIKSTTNDKEKTKKKVSDFISSTSIDEKLATSLKLLLQNTDK